MHLLKNSELDSILNKLSVELSGAKVALAASTKQLEDIQNWMVGVRETGLIINQLASLCQNNCHNKVSGIVTKCLSMVFGSGVYSFSLEVDEKRGQTEARAVLRDAAGNLFSPLKENGGGVVDVVAFGLRMAAFVLSNPRPANVLILDEPFRFVSSSYRPKVVQLLNTISAELGVQIIMVTHIQEYFGGHVIDIGRE